MACTLESSPEWLNPPVARGWTLSTRPLMNAETDKMRATLADQLASFDDKLATKADEVEMLAEIQRGIGRLLSAAGGEEAEIRRMLQERYESGELRKETFQLVKSILDRYVTEQIPTEAQDSPDETDGDGDGAAADAAADDTGMPAERRGAASASDDGDDGFSSTTVIDEPVSAADDADDRVQVGSVLRDRFLLQEKIAGGSMGVVYKALDRRLAEAGADQAHVAIKILSPQLAQSGPALRALQQEAAKGRNLNHPNIVRFIDFDRDDDLYFIVMEWMPGRTLADILDSSDASGIDHDRARAIVRDVGKALVYAHRCGIVHADVKPANVMILPDGSAKLFDFGVARVRQKQAEDDRFDPGVPGAMTPAYSSMQVLTGEEPVPTDDVFALGCLYYRLIAGHRVFGPRNAAEAAEEGMKPQQPAGLADREWKAIRKALSFARVTRFETMQEFLDALAAPDELTVRADDRRSQPTDTGAPGGKGWILALAVVAIAAGSGYVTWQQGWIPELAPRPGAADQPAPGDGPSDVPQSASKDASGQPEDETGAAVAEPAAEPAETETVPDTIVPAAPLPEALPSFPDYSEAPPADVTIPLSYRDPELDPSRIVLREDGEAVVVEFVREDSAEFPLDLRVEEIGFSGNRSPLVSGQLRVSGDGRVNFVEGQERARITLSMASDPLREADQQATLRLREVEMAAAELAIIDVTMEDDDQRAFEASVPPNTVAFAVSQVAVRERDPAVQIDLLRFNPDNQPLVVGFTVRDVTATAGEDYFVPTGNSITFGPGQRSARLLIPLVQDSLAEGDEAFVVELGAAGTSQDADLYFRTAVMIRDDDAPRP